MELDHIFLFVKDEATARDMMEHAGLRVNYSRTHPGQGTRNLCACLDDMYFELLWLDGSPVADASEAIGLGKRGRGDGSPFGLTWRGGADIDCIDYAAPFLPPGITIPVAKASLDKSLPFASQSPRGIPPVHGDKSLVGQRQRPTFGSLKDVTIALPFASKLPAFMRRFERTHFVTGKPSIDASLSVPSGSTTRRFTWSLDG
ncbi:VOC family protein [Ruegeria atlantica]|uniref:VOC family protein n=1 Tax=Ruegeria atlantica TaxID=81569 RepID=UPI00147C9AFD|nr:VOC family protein [Ruegeria atlantica]